MLTALLGAQLLEEAGFPKDLWQVVAGPGSRVGMSIIDKADYVCFTGDIVEKLEHLDEALEILRGIKSPMYGVPGNT